LERLDIEENNTITLDALHQLPKLNYVSAYLSHPSFNAYSIKAFVKKKKKKDKHEIEFNWRCFLYVDWCPPSIVVEHLGYQIVIDTQ
jgi:hypothetical protein